MALRPLYVKTDLYGFLSGRVLMFFIQKGRLVLLYYKITAAHGAAAGRPRSRTLSSWMN